MFQLDTSIAQRIRSLAKAGALSHAIILSGEGDKLTYAKFLAAILLCESAEPPCGHCLNCRKVANGIHPDLQIVLDDSRKELAVDTLRELRKDVYIRPNEGNRKVYIFQDCSQLNERDQNVLLKVVEDGPAYACFIFCTDTASSLLPTIRSRCVEFKLQGSEGLINEDIAKDFISALCSKKISVLAEYLISLENKHMKREILGDLFSSLWCISSEALLQAYGKKEVLFLECTKSLRNTFSKEQLNNLSLLFERMCKECRWNIGVGHVLGATLSELEELLA